MEILQLIFVMMAMGCMEETRSEHVEIMVTGLARHQSARNVSCSSWFSCEHLILLCINCTFGSRIKAVDLLRIQCMVIVR